MSILLRKFIGDTRQNGAQIGLIALVLTVGATGVVAALVAQTILEQEIDASYRVAQAPDLALWFDAVQPQDLAEVAAQEGVVAVEARRVAYLRIAGRDGSWLPMRVTILRDIDSQQVGKIHQHVEPESGAGGGLWIEQSGRSLVAGRPGESLRVRTMSGDIATIPLAGSVHDASVAPSTQERLVYAFATPDWGARIGMDPGFDQLIVKANRGSDTGEVGMLGDALRDRLDASGRKPLRVDVLPSAHPHAALMNAVIRILGVVSAVAFICCTALAGYLVSIWMRREVRQVGIMKTMGARWHQVAIQYLLLVVPLVLVVAGIAVPTGTGLGRAVAGYYAKMLNIDVASWDVGASLVLREAAVMLGIALAAMAVPIIRASRICVWAAIHDAGIALPRTTGSRLASAITVPGGMRATFACRNALRRPLRLSLILLALASGGALLLTTHSNYESLMSVIDSSLATQGHDIEVIMPRSFPGAQLEAVAKQVRDLEVAEAWRRATVQRAYDEADPRFAADAGRMALIGYPPESHLFKLPVLEGRYPAARAFDEVLMTRTMGENHPDIRVGSAVRLRFRDRRVNVRVVGLVEEIGTPVFYAAFPAFEAVTGLDDASNVLRAKAVGDHIDAVANALDQALLTAHLPPLQVLTRTMFRDGLDEHFRVVGDVLRMAALGAAIAGAIILGAGSLVNLLERSREIGVMRALGATVRCIGTILLAEAAAIAIAAALLSVVISVGLTLALNEAAARSLLHVAVPMRFSFEGLAILSGSALVVILVMGLMLTFSLRRTVVETLRYEG